MFQKASQKSLEKCNYYFKLLKRNKNYTLVKEGEELEYLFLVINGTVKVSKKISIASIEITNPKQKSNFIDELKTQRRSSTNSEKGIYEVTKGFIIGGYEFIRSKNVMEFSFQVTSNAAEIFQIKLEHFELLLKSQDLAESFRQKKKTINILYGLFRINLAVQENIFKKSLISENKKQSQFKIFQYKVENDKKIKKIIGECKCQQCFFMCLKSLKISQQVNFNVNHSTLESKTSDRNIFVDSKKRFAKHRPVSQNNNYSSNNNHNSPCIFENFENKIERKVKKMTRGFSSINITPSIDIKPKLNGYFFPKEKKAKRENNFAVKPTNNNGIIKTNSNSKSGRKRRFHSAFLHTLPVPNDQREMTITKLKARSVLTPLKINIKNHLKIPRKIKF